MDRPTRTKQSQIRKTKTDPYNITYMCNLQYNTNAPIDNTETDVTERPVIAKGEGYEGRKD